MQHRAGQSLPHCRIDGETSPAQVSGPALRNPSLSGSILVTFGYNVSLFVPRCLFRILFSCERGLPLSEVKLCAACGHTLAQRNPHSTNLFVIW